MSAVSALSDDITCYIDHLSQCIETVEGFLKANSFLDSDSRSKMEQAVANWRQDIIFFDEKQCVLEQHREQLVGGRSELIQGGLAERILKDSPAFQRDISVAAEDRFNRAGRVYSGVESQMQVANKAEFLQNVDMEYGALLDENRAFFKLMVFVGELDEKNTSQVLGLVTRS